MQFLAEMLQTENRYTGLLVDMPRLTTSSFAADRNNTHRPAQHVVRGPEGTTVSASDS